MGDDQISLSTCYDVVNILINSGYIGPIIEQDLKEEYKNEKVEPDYDKIITDLKTKIVNELIDRLDDESFRKIIYDNLEVNIETYKDSDGKLLTFSLESLSIPREKFIIE